MKTVRISVILGLLFCIAASGQGATFTFQKIVDSRTAIPGGTGTFTIFGIIPALDGDKVAFWGGGSGGQSGIYTSLDGALTVVVDTHTEIPGGTGTFTNFSFGPALDGGNVAFVGHGSGGQDGLYVSVDGTLQVAADSSTPVPNGAGNFHFFEFTSLDGSDVAFAGSGPDQQGVYTHVGGSLRTVVDLDTLVPGSTRTFSDFNAPRFDDGEVAFRALDSGFRAGLYITVGGELMVLADASTPVPGGTGFAFFNGSPALDAGNVAFRAAYRAMDSSRRQGLFFATAGGPLTIVADSNTPIPGSTGLFTSFADPALDGSNVAFLGRGSGDHQGIYIATGGSLMKVIDTSDLLEGRQVSSFLMEDNGLSGDSLVFLARFTDGTEGIFLAEPESRPNGIDIDIQPGAFPNSINPRSKGVVPVAILTTATFDATAVDPLSVSFGPSGALEAHGKGHVQDVDGDGDVDLMLHFRTQEAGIRCGDTAASLTGETLEGDPIQGSDSIRTVGCK